MTKTSKSLAIAEKDFSLVVPDIIPNQQKYLTKHKALKKLDLL